MSVRIHLLVLLQLMCLACSHNRDVADLPKSSAEFFTTFSCNSIDNNEFNIDEGDNSFFRWVLSARHTTWHPGWEVAPRSDTSATGEGKYYARVFDLLNWSRKQNLLPVSADISSICHKGMEIQFMNGTICWTENNEVPPKPNEFIPCEMWSNLWNTCHKQLLSTTRISSSCIDIPGILVENPSPPLSVNNPCHLQYRMVDGAHRICLRKYLLTLLTGELEELEEHVKRENHKNSAKDVFGDNVGTIAVKRSNTENHYRQKQRLVNQAERGLFLVMNQTTFQSMLMSSDPHVSWAKDKESLKKDITKDLQLEWKKWMQGVMGRVAKRKEDDGILPQEENAGGEGDCRIGVEGGQ